jgi:two-component system, NarL family, response regulator NreC
MNAHARVVLSETTLGIRQELCDALRAKATITIVDDPVEARTALATAGRQDPTVVLVEVIGGASGGTDSIARIKARHPHIPVVAIVEDPTVTDLRGVVHAGANGCLPREMIHTELGDAVLAAARGESYLSPTVATMILDDYRDHLSPHSSQCGPSLTEREAQVLQLVSEGHTNESIGRQLGVSVKTVETHRAHLMHKLDVHDRTDLVKYAVRTGVIVMD